MTFVWSFVLVTMLNYVVSSINDVPFDFALGAIVSVVLSILVFIVSAILPTESTPDYDA
ncbi:putative PurR-regulated permease PerM [Bhargavaea ullalensis]|uniref:PurR-regulated permease PerM n=2 Tax=Bhargavaea ullalensis TaxID=1265685 RepID=A0ABV2GBJ4_9BACL